jgi:hypothetical protein
VSGEEAVQGGEGDGQPVGAVALLVDGLVEGLVQLERLEQQLEGSRRVMNDLRRLRKLLVGEADEVARPASTGPAAPPSADGAEEPWDDS